MLYEEMLYNYMRTNMRRKY